MRPTRTREKKMKKSNRNGYKEVISEVGALFVNQGTAILAMQALQFVIASQGYDTYSEIVPKHGRIELQVHIDKPFAPSIPNGYTFTTRRITSQDYYSEREHIDYKLRVVHYEFKYNK